MNLNGEQGLAFVRSRKLEILDEDEDWVNDPLSDENRVQRQQIFIQRAMADALAEVKSNPLRLRELVDIGVSNITLDPNLGIGDILDLADHFKGFDPSKLETYPLPVTEYPPDPNRLLLDEAGAEPMLNVFRGLAAGRDPAGPGDGQGAQRHRRRRGATARGPGLRRQRRPPAGRASRWRPPTTPRRSTRRRRSSTHRGSRRYAAAGRPPHHQRHGHPHGREPRRRRGDTCG